MIFAFKNRTCLFLIFILIVIGFSQALSAQPPSPIRIGCPLPLGFVYGRAAERGIRLAVEEINAKGGVNVGGVRRPFTLDVMDTRDLEPGIPVSEALLAVERLILEKRVDFLVGGPLRSEAALAAMDTEIPRHCRAYFLTGSKHQRLAP